MVSAYKFFINIGNCNDGRHGNKKMLGATTKAQEEYFKFLQMRAENIKMINITLNKKRSNLFTTISIEFNGNKKSYHKHNWNTII